MTSSACARHLPVFTSLPCTVLLAHHASRAAHPSQPSPPQVDDELEIKAYYAGHVLGAAMFQIRVGSESVVYTVSGSAGGTGWAAWAGWGHCSSCCFLCQGDYNMTPDRHLG